MGGFDASSKSLQHIFTFARLIDIVAMYLSPEAQGKTVSVIAAIAAGNGRSFGNMKAIGMTEVAPWPRWLDYEHRAWFPKLTEKARDRDTEATYLWFPPDAIRTFMSEVEPYVSGRQLLQRKSRQDPGRTESYGVSLDGLLAYEDIVGRFDGSLEKAIRHIPYASLFTAPPDLARLDKDRDDQPDSEVVF
jgi:hypothetical protein